MRSRKGKHGRTVYTSFFIYPARTRACFNTGLLTRRYKPIYGCFIRNKREASMQDWHLQGFVAILISSRIWCSSASSTPGDNSDAPIFTLSPKCSIIYI
ncbi:MAG TPA: DUF3825 domain-containing protein [Clostridia bacterium]|nr:DUF3825 domain-containing protein [Clostridia bacterium]